MASQDGALLAQSDYDVALDSFGKNRIQDCTDEEKRIDCKALSVSKPVDLG